MTTSNSDNNEKKDSFFIKVERKATKLIDKEYYEAAEQEAASFNKLFKVGDPLIYKEMPVTIKYGASVICTTPVVWFNEITGPVNLNEVLIQDTELERFLAGRD